MSSRRFAASDCLLERIETVLASRAPATISNGADHVYIDPGRRRFRQSIRDPRRFFAVPSKSAELSRDERDSGGAWRPVEELLWEAAYHGSRGALLDRHNPLATVRLQRWPNLARLSHTPAMIPLCALVHRRASSMSVANRLLKVPEPEAWRFFSAALASGLAREIRADQPDTARRSEGAATQRVSLFWARLFRRLGGV